MQIREGMEQRYAEFAASQNATAEGRALVQFMETWSGMMECAVEHGADSITDAAALTVQAAAKSAGLSEDSAVIEGAAAMLDCWSYGRGLREWYLYRPPEILDANPKCLLDIFSVSRELCSAIPAITEAYPCILETSPDLLDAHRNAVQAQLEHHCPTMSM